MKESARPFRILFLCTGNSARSVFGEYLIRRVAPVAFESFSAGSDPKGEVHPMTLRVLSEIHKIDASDAESKSWDRFREDGTIFDFVITVCDHARETCPVWPGQPVIAHWGSMDPAAVEGTEEEVFDAFKKVSIEIRRRVELFASLPFEKLDRLRLEQLTKEIGESKEALA
ncbi:MAG: arsenate reductase ArsC [Verrucomicrobiae bacterium]|nr:arsenate reductase ArsC [Verrucomicrobiae bacterium]